MFNKVIVGVDGEEGGRDAIALASRLMAKDGELTLAYAYHGDPHVWRGSSPPYEAAETERTRGLLRRAREEAGVEAQLRWEGSPSVGRGLHELAEATGADLLVVGSSRRGVLGRVMLGDDTRAALNGAPCAVAIAPAGYAHEPHLMREIGIGYNGSAESEHALAVARSLASMHTAKLSAFEAVSLPTTAYMSAGLPPEEVVEEMVRSARERVAALDGVEPHAAYGPAAEELALYSASLDLLVLGSRDYGPLGRLVHGSTSQQLARNARCPLLVLTRAARAALPEPGRDSAGELAITPSGS
jgi:nucleotide-binding universal stress UspA family protein